MANLFIKNVRKLIENIAVGRIVKRGLDLAPARKALDGQRGIAYSGGIETTASGSSGAGGSTMGSTTLLLLPFKGASIDPNNTQSLITGGGGIGGTGDGKSIGSWNATDLLDFFKDGGFQDYNVGELDSNDSGTLKELTGLVDCESGIEIEIRLDGTPIPPEGYFNVEKELQGQPQFWPEFKMILMNIVVGVQDVCIEVLPAQLTAPLLVKC
jgi:hypothetical protein